ncbi:MAG: hypothetical protein LH645_07590 [Actinomycetia bacterium]|nr:hypothetical protein [Actinomycetes bacterium]
MSQTTATDVLEIIESPDLAQFDDGPSHGVMKGILIALGIAVIAAAVATIFSRRSDSTS